MKKKLTILAFGLLLAVGWTNDASAQLLREYQATEWAEDIEERADAPKTVTKAQTSATVGVQDQAHKVMPMMTKNSSTKKNAPRRAESVTASATHVRSWYANYYYTWYDASNASHTAYLTDSVINPYQMYYLTAAAYITTSIPGILHSDGHYQDVPYLGIAKGYGITGTNYVDNIITLSSSNVLINAIYIHDAASGTSFTSWTGGSLPTNWTSSKTLQSRTVSNTTWYYMNGGGDITIPHSALDGRDSVYFRITMRTYSGDTKVDTLWVNSSNYYRPTTSSTTVKFSTIVGGIDRPTENGYTVFLVKVKDTDYSNVVEQTTTKAELVNFFNTYVGSMEILTDGLRVNEGDPEAGTVFAYQGVLDKFFFISKGKMYWVNGDRAPYYSMYEEFSPYVESQTANQKDLYSNMYVGDYYPIVHDCQGVIHMNHFFSMAGKDTIAPKSVAPLIFYIPDNRGDRSLKRTYREDHQPQVGLYTIKLTAETEPSATYAQDSTYTVTLDWTSNLDEMVNSTIDQTYIIYTVTFDEHGNRVYHPLDTLVNPEVLTYSYDVPQTQASQQITYVILGYPTDATNNYARDGIFYTYSNLDDVQIPGWFDFMILYRERYESDFIIQEEKNYYRNYLYPTNISHGTGMTMEQLKTEWPNQTASYTLWRDNTGIAVLEVKAIGKKVYYRIRYYDETQVTTGVNNIEIPNGYQTISND